MKLIVTGHRSGFDDDPVKVTIHEGTPLVVWGEVLRDWFGDEHPEATSAQQLQDIVSALNGNEGCEIRVFSVTGSVKEMEVDY
jgi:predicted DNA-binding transcriptional regulator YafY